MASEKIKITRKEFDELYDIQEDNSVQNEEEITVKEVPPEESWEDMTERKDKEKYGS